MAGKDLLSRIDLIDESDPLLPMIQFQEDQCPVPDLYNITSQLSIEDKRDQVLIELNAFVQKDLQIRSIAVRDYSISVAHELFYFGRPLFQVLHPLGLVATETSKGLVLQFNSC